MSFAMVCRAEANHIFNLICATLRKLDYMMGFTIWSSVGSYK